MASPSGATDLERLCRACGLCCDGSLFGRVDLEPDEIEPARRRRLTVIPSGKSFEQPCTALVRAEEGGFSCTVYASRPRACDRFVCRLFEEHRTNGGPLETRLAVVRRARSLLAAGSYDELTPLLAESFARHTPE